MLVSSIEWTPTLKLWKDEQGQDIAEYAVMLAVILVLVVGKYDSIKLIRTEDETF